jgi:2-phospho-L-lactate guanylyltransferase
MNQQKRIWAVVPVKSFARAKARLSPLLDLRQRAELARAMLTDVLVGLRHVGGLSGILVVTRDPGAADIARAHAAETIGDPLERGANAAIELAIPVLLARGADAMLAVPGDVPQIEPGELTPITAALDGPSVTLVAAARDGGTNLLGCAPVDVIAPCFGVNSFARHVAAARQMALEPRVFAARSLAHDLDRAADLREFQARHPTQTGTYLAELFSKAHEMDRAAAVQ